MVILEGLSAAVIVLALPVVEGYEKNRRLRRPAEMLCCCHSRELGSRGRLAESIGVSQTVTGGLG
jgi:hypothetical protein